MGAVSTTAGVSRRQSGRVCGGAVRGDARGRGLGCVAACMVALSLVAGCSDEEAPSGGAALSNDVTAPADVAPPTDCPPAIPLDTTRAWDATGGAADVPPAESPPLPRIDVQISQKDWDAMHVDPQSTEEYDVVLTVGGKSFPQTEMELHGGYARTVPKKSYRFTIEDDLKSELDLFGDGVERQRRFVLKASWNDRTWMRGPLTMDLLRDHGVMAPRERHAELYVNGEYHGLYVLVERIDRLFVARQGLEKEHCNLYKAENHNANWKPKADPLLGYDQELGKEGDTGDLGALLDACGKTPTTAEEFEEHVQPWLSLTDFLAWQMVDTFADNHDTYTKNYLLYHDRTASFGDVTHPFRIIAWDADATWGNNWNGEPLDPTEEGQWHGTDGFSPRLFAIPSWRQAYAEAYRAALGDALEPQAIGGRIDALAVELRGAAIRDLAKWQPSFSFDCEVERLREAVAARHQKMSDVVEGL